MRLIDERGRVFGKVNLLDGFVGLTGLLLLPLAYGAFLLFRPPRVELTSLEPASVPQGVATAIKLRGKNLGPWLQVRITDQNAVYHVESTDQAEVIIPPQLAAGTYTLQLQDQANVLGKAELTILPPPAELASHVFPDLWQESSVNVVFLTRSTVVERVDKPGGAVIQGCQQREVPGTIAVDNMMVSQSVTRLQCTVRLTVHFSQGLWTYGAYAIRRGAPFTFNGMAGWVQ